MKQLIVVPFILLMVGVLFAQAKNEPDSYKIGDRGPGGGLVFYIEGNRYWEASGSLGKVNWDDALTLAKDYQVGGYDDWYLPTKDQLNYIYENLRKKDFIKDDGFFWSSSEDLNNYAWDQRFSDGNQTLNLSKYSTAGVRAVRAFTIGEIAGLAKAKNEPKAYKIGDRGPGGGIVFYIEGNRYWEVSRYLGEADWWNAKDLATDYRGGGYDDWYLPSKEELNYIYENLRKKDFIWDDGWSWTSSEGNNDCAWGQRFSDGYQSNSSRYAYKDYTLEVRAVRAFTIGKIAGLAKAESKPKAYEIGDRGPGGGLVFYIEENTYLEVSEYLGKVNWDDALTLATDYQGGGYDDWYLPTKDELNYIYENLVKGSISDDGWLWSSSENSNNYARTQLFSDYQDHGITTNTYKDNTAGVRAVRAFTISSGEIAGTAAKAESDPKAYKIGDRGPGGGLVFYIEGNTYLEASEYLGKANWDDAKDFATDYRGGGYDDWYLPTLDELNYIYENLRVKGFIKDDGYFWSSFELYGISAWYQRFSDGNQSSYYSTIYEDSTLGVRAVRAFTSYKIGDRGPGGGLVFHIEGNRYLEASEILGEVNWVDALTLAKDYQGGGYDDWYLPSKDELNYIYENLRVKGFIKDDGWLWSSSEINDSCTWNQRFSDSNQSNGFKSNTLGVRAVRAFNPSSL